MPILAQITSDDVLDSAYEWLCRRRRDYSANSDVWALRRNWPCEKETIKRELLSGNYRFSLLTGSRSRMARTPICGRPAVRHRQTKGAATDMFDLHPPHHISTLAFATEMVRCRDLSKWAQAV